MSIESLEKSTVDRCRIDSLIYLYFGNTDNQIKASSHRAYLDMCRTIRKDDGINLLDIEVKGQKILEQEVTKVLKYCSDQEQYNQWHKEVCTKLVGLYEDEKVKLYFGQAQKWVNMTMKYMYIITGDEMKKVFPFFHIPLDNYVYSAVKQKLGIKRQKKRWSRIDTYEEYMNYQREMCEKIKGQTPIEWEIFNWLEEAKNQNPI